MGVRCFVRSVRVLVCRGGRHIPAIGEDTRKEVSEKKFQTNGVLYDQLKAKRLRYNYLLGGASSGKSHCLAQFLAVERFLSTERFGLLAIRKTRPAVKASCWENVRHYLRRLQEDEGLDKPFWEENKSDLILTSNTGNTWRFSGLDNMYKVRSMEGLNQIWVEEAAAVGNEAAFAEREITQLDMICRAGGLEQMWFSMNPVDPIGNKWLKDRCDGANADPDSQLIQVNHGDNLFLSEDGHRVIESLIETDAEYDKIYRQGLWATPTCLIYDKWDIVPAMPEKYTLRLWGLDFGYSTNPAALTEIRFVATREVYIKEHIHQTQVTNPELIAMLKLVDVEEGVQGVPKNEPIVADSAEPKSIQELRNAGYNMFGAFKGPDSVRFGIRTLQGVMQHITADSTKMIEEIGGYKWSVDVDGNVKQPPKPVELKDHCMDANRYAITKELGLTKAGMIFAEEEQVKQVHNLASEDYGWSDL